MSTGDNVKYIIKAEGDFMSNSIPMYQYVVSISIAMQKIVKALMFNEQRIVGLCLSLNLKAVNFSKVSNG
jgi:hypothetical protein